MVSSPLADFTKLPWNDGSKDINFDQPFIGDGIVHQPFANQNLLLKAGIHLHFIIPKYLGQQIPNNTGLLNAGQLPAAPNRWLIKRNDDKYWIIESDYIHGEDYDPNNSGRKDEQTCVIPFHQGKPFRYMGKKTLIDPSSPSYRPGNQTFKTLNNNKKPLTVQGYGDMNFSSFYPNCLGVFGFHDDTTTPSSSLKYSVIGWNAEIEDDLLHSTITSIINKNPSITNDQLNTRLKNLFKLDLSDKNNLITSSSVPRTIFYGEMTVDHGPDNPSLTNVEIAIGNTGTEALSALIAKQLSNSSKEVLKTKLEDQLESVLLFSKLDHLITDVGPKFIEARHEKGFRSSHSGHIWNIVSHSGRNNTINTSTKKPAIPELPDGLENLLNTLNLAQNAYDKKNHEIITLKEQLYFDWYKYMHAAYPPLEGRGQYPDPDHIRYFVENYSIAELKELITTTGNIVYGDANSGFKPTATTKKSTDLANKLCEAWKTANDFLTNENLTRAENKQPTLSLSMIAGPRYWEPNAPAIMISGIPGDTEDVIVPKDNYLKVKVASLIQSLDMKNLTTITSESIDNQHIENFSYQLSKQNYNSFILDWELDLLNTNFKNNLGAFDPAAIQKNYTIDPLGPDFDTNKYKTGDLSVFSGSILMSTHTKRSLLLNLRSFIENTLEKAGVEFTNKFTLDDFLPKDSSTQWSDVLKNIPTPLSSNDEYTIITTVTDYSRNPIYTAWTAYQKILDKNILSQMLNGFNQASIMKNKSAQLPIADPLGFDDAKAFTSEINQLVEHNKDTSPIMAFDFNPIRSGKLTINRLRLTDNFGISFDIQMESITQTASETLLDDGEKLFLRPRLAQPARLNFRWLSAQSTDPDSTIETNDHPDTIPICGWLMPNYIDDTIAVYAADGSALGYIDNSAKWNALPWSNTVANVSSDIVNPHLLKTVQWIIDTYQNSSDDVKFNDFLSAIQVALNNTAPANSHLYDTKSVLMGRPIAVVRAALSFQIKGLPAIDQSWPALLSDLNNCDLDNTFQYKNRNTNDWSSVKFPLRLGEYKQLNDGLIGYWTENAQGSINSKFFAPETDSSATTDAQIDTFSTTKYQEQWLALNDDPLNVTMLVDPRGIVHATTGILPVKAISIPPQQYAPAFKKLNMWFNTTPILQPLLEKDDKLLLNLPKVNGYKWQWWDAFNGTISINGDPPNKNLHEEFKLINGWLNLIPNSKK